MIAGQEPLRAGAQGSAQSRFSTDRDPRAENNRRTIHFEPDRIVIVRRVHGVAMRVTMPVARYEGIGVLLPNLAEGRHGFRVVLAHADPDISVTLCESADPAMVDAALAEWSIYFGLPVLGAAPPAIAPPISSQTAAPGIACGERPPLRRRGGALAKRRPRLYARRHPGNIAFMQQVHSEEREIIARD